MIFSKIEGQGKPFLIIHGFLGMLNNWEILENGGKKFGRGGILRGER